RRWHTSEAIDATGIRYNGLHQHPVAIEPNSPTLQPQFVEVEYLVEVGVEPRGTVQTARARDSSDIDRDACARRLRGIVPRYAGSVGESRPGGKSRRNVAPKSYVDRLSGLHRPVPRRVVGGQQGAYDSDTRHGAVHRCC